MMLRRVVALAGQTHSHRVGAIMKATEAQETEELALLAELARPVVHECNNFLNNLLLQLAISENDLPDAHRADWQRVRNAGKNLGRLLQEWQRQRISFADGPARTPVQPLVQEIVEAARLEDDSVLFSLHMPAEPLWLASPRAEAKRLCWILLRYATAELQAFAKEAPALEIQVDRIEGGISFHVQEIGPAPATLFWRDFDGDIKNGADECNLLAAACRSMTERLGGSIRIDKSSADRPVLLLKLPAAA